MRPLARNAKGDCDRSGWWIHVGYSPKFYQRSLFGSLDGEGVTKNQLITIFALVQSGSRYGLIYRGVAPGTADLGRDQITEIDGVTRGGLG